MPTQGRHTPGEVVLAIHRVVQECPHWSSCGIYGKGGQGFDVLWSRWHVYEESKLDLGQAAHPDISKVFTLLRGKLLGGVEEGLQELLEFSSLI